jgi:two-component system sensor histidine kinase DegS
LELLAISKNVRDIIQDMRYIIYNLRPMSLDDITLDNMIEKEVSKIKKNEILNVSYETLGEPINISPMISLNIFRVVQEACNNILNHAKAKNVLIQVEYSEDDVEILIEDDGVGFTINDIQNLKGEEGSGFGISVMRERVYLFSGRLDVNSEPGKGTRIFVKVPIDKEDA